MTPAHIALVWSNRIVSVVNRWYFGIVSLALFSCVLEGSEHTLFFKCVRWKRSRPVLGWILCTRSELQGVWGVRIHQYDRLMGITFQLKITKFSCILHSKTYRQYIGTLLDTWKAELRSRVQRGNGIRSRVHSPMTLRWCQCSAWSCCRLCCNTRKCITAAS